MVSLFGFSHDISKDNIIYHISFISKSNDFTSEFTEGKNHFSISIYSNGLICKIKILKKYWFLFCDNKMYNTIYFERNKMYINILCKKDFAINKVKESVVINQSIMSYLCKIILYLKIPKKLFYTKDTNNKICKRNKKDKGITALVISDNRKCICNLHRLQDVTLIVRIVLKNGKISNSGIQSSYCKICDEYFVLKSDYYKLKERGAILCLIEDRTVEQKCNKRYDNVGNESRIHQLGYNVKKENKLSFAQRKIILANIIENTDITRGEIKSNLVRCINQHKRQKNYENAVCSWEADLEFINNYHIGDIPEIKVEKLILMYKRDDE